MDPQPPTPAPTEGDRAHSRMFPIQVRAFIEASEVVDADPDTIEDILDGFDDEAEILAVEDDPEVDVQDDANDDETPLNDHDEQFLALLEEGASLVSRRVFLMVRVCSWQPRTTPASHVERPNMLRSNANYSQMPRLQPSQRGARTK